MSYNIIHIRIKQHCNVLFFLIKDRMMYSIQNCDSYKQIWIKKLFQNRIFS
jgi:hypothetical protein